MGLTVTQGTTIFEGISLADHLGNIITDQEAESILISEAEAITLFGTIQDVLTTITVSEC